MTSTEKSNTGHAGGKMFCFVLKVSFYSGFISPIYQIGIAKGHKYEFARRREITSESESVFVPDLDELFYLAFCFIY